jgi:hypothetical protein
MPMVAPNQGVLGDPYTLELLAASLREAIDCGAPPSTTRARAHLLPNSRAVRPDHGFMYRWRFYDSYGHH